MKTMLIILAGFASCAAQAQDAVLVPVGSASLQPTTSSATLTPNGVYWTFNTPKASVTLTPRGESYTTFRSANSSMTLLPQGQVIFTVSGR
jgi:hypothetical protein